MRNYLFSSVFILAAILFCVMLWIAWLNRTSPRVQEILFPAIVAGLIIPLFAIFFSLKEETKQVTSPVTIFYDPETKRDISLDSLYKSQNGISRTNNTALLPPEYLSSSYHQSIQRYISFVFGKLSGPKSYEGFEENGEISNDMYLYLEAITFVIIREMYDKFGKGWQVKENKFIGPSSITTRSESKNPLKATKLSWKDLEKIAQASEVFHNNDFPNKLPSISSALYLPPKTNLIMSKDGFRMSINLNNGFVDLNIELMPLSLDETIGEYGRLINVDPNVVRINHATYQVSCNAKFSRWKSGNPKMPEYKNWVEEIF